MFYNTEILTSRKGGLAVFWLAATLGSKGTGAVKKLSKAEILKSNIVRACEKVISPEEPLALRLSSNLMMGIARVYQTKYNIHANEVHLVHQHLKKVILEGALTGPDRTLGTEIDLTLAPLPEAPVFNVKAKAAAQPQGINLTIDTGIAFVGFDPDVDLTFDWRMPGEKVAEDQAMDLGEEPSFFSPAREADITLQEPQLDDYLMQGAAADDLFPSGDFGGEQPAFGEDEEGLLYGVSPELDAVLRASSAAGRGSGVGSARGSAQRWGPSSSAVGGPLDMGGFDDNFVQQEYGGGFDGGFMDEGLPQIGDETYEERVRREHEEARARLEGGAFRRSPTPLITDVDMSRELKEGESTPSSAARKRVSDALQQVQAKSAQKPAPVHKPKKQKRIPIDRTTELTNEEFRNMRASYPERMAAEREKSEKAKQDREAHQRAMDLVFGVPALFQAPELADFWKTTVSDQLAPFAGGTADEKKRRVSPRTAQKKAKEPQPEAETSRGQKRRLSEQPQGGLLGDFGAGGDIFGGQDFGGDVEYGRDYGGGFDEFQFDQEVEQGRAGSEAGLTGSHRPSMLPWAQEAATSDIGGALPEFGRPSSRPGGSRVSLDTPLKRDIAQYSRAGSLVPSALGTSPQHAASIGLLAEQDEFAAFEEGRLSRSPSPHPSGAGAFDAAVKESESLKFLNYAKRQRQSLAQDDQLLFSDIVPVADTNASTAAQALYHLLVLATKKMVRVQQDEAYGEIAVDIL
ncbi:R8 protein [Rhodosporidiobolus nylandii]